MTSLKGLDNLGSQSELAPQIISQCDTGLTIRASNPPQRSRNGQLAPVFSTPSRFRIDTGSQGPKNRCRGTRIHPNNPSPSPHGPSPIFHTHNYRSRLLWRSARPQLSCRGCALCGARSLLLLWVFRYLTKSPRFIIITTANTRVCVL